MATFSGTNLPPVVRLGGSSDLVFNVRGGTADILPPRYVQHRYFEATAVALETVELPVSRTKKMKPKSRRKGDRLRYAMRRK